MKTTEHHEENTDEKNAPNLSRRKFLGVSAALSIVALSGCGTLGNESSTGTSGAATEAVLAKAITGKMFSVPGGANLQDGQTMVFTLPDGGSAGILLHIKGQLHALAAKCPHAGCVVAWQKTHFHCPCHGSNFSDSGKVLNGPAKTSLTTWTVSAQGNDAIVMT